MLTAPQVIAQWLTSPRPAVVFDFNGTLSDDEPILFDIFRELFAAHLGWEMSNDDYRTDLLGRSDREIVERAVARHGSGGAAQVEELLRLRTVAYRRRVGQTPTISDATVRLVKMLADSGIPLGIVTGAQRDDVTAVLAHSPAGNHFPVVVTEEDVARGKPHPEGFLTAAALLGRRPIDVLVFEDSVPGVTAAVAAGMHCIAVASAQSDPELGAVAPAVVTALSCDLVQDALASWPGPRLSR